MLCDYFVRKNVCFIGLILFSAIAGCGSKVIKELKSADGLIVVQVIDPRECDQSVDAIGLITGSGPELWLNEKVTLDNRACHREFNVNDYIVIEGPGWFGVASQTLIALPDKAPGFGIYAFVDRKERTCYVEYGEDSAPPPLWPEILLEVVRRRSGPVPE